MIRFSILFVFILVLVVQTEGWRRRRRRRCNRTPCAVSAWRPFGACSQPCGRRGIKTRTRTITRHPGQCGAKCPPLTETVSCNTSPAYCRNRGTVQDYGCACRAPYTGRCCENINCQEAICTLQPWTTWADMSSPVNDHCASQSRRRRYRKTWRTVVKPSCSGVSQKCNNDIIATREKVVYCQPLTRPSLGAYSPTQCATQRLKCRAACTLTCSAAQRLVLVGSSAQARRQCLANGHWSSLGAQCKRKCQEAVCTLQPWSAWADMSSPVSGYCASQSRRRRYRKTWRTVIQTSCSGLSQTCNKDIVATREKIVYCQPLAAPSLGSYHSSDCVSQRKQCRQICMLTCPASLGLAMVGSSAQARRECQASGQWSSLRAHCRDVQAPTITCPSNMAVSNDKDKQYARVRIPAPVSVRDNSGINPMVEITPAHMGSVYDFPISKPSSIGTRVTYTVTDGAGLKASCYFYVKVRDVEKPKIISCPAGVTKETEEQQTRVYWTPPVFSDNYKAKDPVITSTTAPGAMFHWGTYTITYVATDVWGNAAKCQFTITVKPLSCQLYDPPVHGARTCNIKASGATQELICTVQCNENFDFGQSMPWYAFLCNNHGVWHGYRYSSAAPVSLPPGYGRPWTDCTLKTLPNGLKDATVYSGKCNPYVGATKQQLQQNFLNSINDDTFLKKLLCESNQGKDCALANVKVYCGKNSRK